MPALFPVLKTRFSIQIQANEATAFPRVVVPAVANKTKKKNIWEDSVDNDYSPNSPMLHNIVLHTMLTSLRANYENVSYHYYQEEGSSEAGGGSYGKMKRLIKIRRDIDEEDLFDGGPPYADPNFWVLLLTRGAAYVDVVSVYLTVESCTHPLPTPAACFRWYPRSLLKTLLLVSYEDE